MQNSLLLMYKRFIKFLQGTAHVSFTLPKHILNVLKNFVEIRLGFNKFLRYVIYVYV